MTAIDDVIM